MAVDILPPCQWGCPVRTDAGRYARLIAEGRFDEAYRVITATNPFPSVCAHICQRQCEANCRRAMVDAPVALRALKRFVVQQNEEAPDARPEPSELRGKGQVAVVGAGPAGLTAAHDLRMKGFRVTILERLDRAGGMLNVIPRYRLPQAALDSDVDRILSAGIEVTCGCDVGNDLTVAELVEQGADAVVVTTGLSRSRGIAIPGFGAQRFTAAIPWMTDVWLGNKVDVGRRVAVIGGGNVAIDVARTARRLGAEYVAMIFVESMEEIPAEHEEVVLAEAEGISLFPSRAPKRVLNHDGKISAIEMMAVTSVFDDQGRFRPTYDPARISTLGVDMMILSIGQAPDQSWARESSVRVDQRGRIVVDRETHLTDNPQIFLAGESLRGPGSAIQAVADGHRVARIVTHFLESGQIIRPQPDEDKPLEPFPPEVIEKLRQIHSVAKEPEPFASGEPMMSENEARREAERCLGCLAGAQIDEDKCAACLTCLRVCPLDAVEIGDTLFANPERCQACGLCAAVCPAKAISVPYWQFEELEAALNDLDNGGGETEVAIACRYNTDAEIKGTRVLTVPCLVRLTPADLLRVFHHGYRSVSLHACSRDECKYGAAWDNIEFTVDRVRSVLAQVLPEGRIEVNCPVSEAAD